MDMKLRATPTQLEALRHGHYLDDDQAEVTLEGVHITYTDRDAAWRVLVDASNLADEWAAHWRDQKEPVLARAAGRASRALGALSSKVVRSS